MSKFLWAILFSVCTTICFGQTSDQKDTEKRIVLSVIPAASAVRNPEQHTSRELFGHGKINLSAAFQYHANRTVYQIGLSHFTLGFSCFKGVGTPNSASGNQFGFGETLSPNQGWILILGHHLIVPAKVGYKLINRGFFQFTSLLSLDVGFQYQSRSKRSYLKGYELQSKNTDFEGYFGTSASLQMDFRLSDRTNLQINPMMLIELPVLREFNYNTMGVGVGVNYKI